VIITHIQSKICHLTLNCVASLYRVKYERVHWIFFSTYFSLWRGLTSASSDTYLFTFCEITSNYCHLNACQQDNASALRPRETVKLLYRKKPDLCISCWIFERQTAHTSTHLNIRYEWPFRNVFTTQTERWWNSGWFRPGHYRKGWCKKTSACVCAKSAHFKHIMWTLSDRMWLVLCDWFAQYIITKIIREMQYFVR